MSRGALKYLTISLLLGAVGCRKADSSDVRTADVYAEFTVTEYSTVEAKVDATLWVGSALSNTYLTLTGQDRLTVYVGSDVHPMLGQADIAQHYFALIPYPPTDTELRLAFERGPDDVSAPGSTVIVPALFGMAAPSGSQYSRAVDALEIGWAPFDASQLVSWSVYGACVQAFSADGVMDTGRLAIPAGTLKKPPDPGPDEEHHPIPPDACQATASVIKSREGHLDPALSGGTFEASQARSVTFTSVR